jgi:hypothetical protein
MENEKRKLVIIGYSHAYRLFKSCKENRVLTENFDILGKTFRGATWPQVKEQIKRFLQQPFTSRDILVFQIFGNDLLKKGLHYRDFSTGIIHLRNFVPASDVDVGIAYDSFREILKSTSASVIVIDNPLRHLRCCELHLPNHTGLASYFRKRNKELVTTLQDWPVIDHRRLIPSIPFRNLRQTFFYVQLLDTDKVHFKQHVYDEWADSLARQLGFNY